MIRNTLGCGLVALCLTGSVAPAALAAPSPRMLLETVDLTGLAVSPDGRRVAFRQEQASVEHNTYLSGWFVQSLDGEGPPRRLADGGAPLRGLYGPSLNEAPQWSSDNRWIYYRALIDGAVQIWRAAADGSSAEPVSHDLADVESFTLSSDSRRLLYTVGAARERIRRAEQAEADQGVRIDRTVPIGQGVFRSGYINGRLADVRLTGDWMDRRGLLADQPQQQVVVDLATLASRDASAEDIAAFADRSPVAVLKASNAPPNGTDLRARSAASGAVAFIQAVGASTILRVAADARSSASTACAAKTCQNIRIAGLAWRPGRDEVVFTTSDRQRGDQSLYDWDVATSAVRLIVSAPGLIGGGRGDTLGESCAVGAAVAVCVTAAADTPPRLERVDLQTGRRAVLYDPNAALAASRGPRAQFLQWTDAEGHAFTGQYFPAATGSSAGPAPLFITYYACPGFLRGGIGEEWPLASLAGAGIAALCVQAPPIDAAHQDQLANYNAALSGVRHIVAMLQARGQVDPSRVGMGGLSFGSEVVMWLAMKSNLLAAGSIASPSVTPTYYRVHDLQGESFRANLMRAWGLGPPGETSDRWKQMSPAFNVAQIQAPLLMQMPEQEYIEALDYFVPLAKSPTPTELYVFPNEPHLMITPRHQLAAFDRNLDWFRFWLQDYVDPDPLKADQYRRWQAMRVRAQAAGQHPGRAAPASGVSR
jgi:dipeptidyl aminopeptidase/acylaminoacyl peptidase